MKKILFIASAILILLSGCESFLDSELLTEKTTANFPETEKDAQEMVTAIYAHLLFESPETSSQYYIAQLAGDDCLGGNLSYSNNCATNFLMYSGNLNTFAGIWDRCYTLINRANNAINTMENVKSWSSESERNRLFGESYFLRAMAYYELAQVFGGVPLRTTLESTNLPRASVDEIYAQIAADLKNAIEMMPAKISERLRHDRTRYKICRRSHDGTCIPFLYRTLRKNRASQRNYQRGGHLLDR